MNEENNTVPFIWEVDVDQANQVTAAVIEKTMRHIAIIYLSDTEYCKIARTKALSFEL